MDNQTVIDLLALRASMSVVDKNVNEVLSAESDIASCEEQQTSKTAELYDRITCYRNGISSDDSIVNDHLNGIRRERLEYLRKKQKKFDFDEVALGIIISISIISLILSMVLPWTGATKYPFAFLFTNLKSIPAIKAYEYIDHQDYLDDYVAAILSGIFLALFVCAITFGALFVIARILRKSYRKRRTDTAIEEAVDNYMEKYENSKNFEAIRDELIEENQRHVSNNNTVIRSASIEIDKINKEFERKISQYRKRAEIYAKITKSDMEFLENKYEYLLHPSDWENIDYIIYLFVTRRADSMKEALQLLDRQKQTEMIVKAIVSSAKYLSQNITSAINKLGSDLQTQLSDINLSLLRIHDTVLLSAKQAHADRMAIKNSVVNTGLLMASFSIESNSIMRNINGVLNRNSTY